MISNPFSIISVSLISSSSLSTFLSKAPSLRLISLGSSAISPISILIFFSSSLNTQFVGSYSNPMFTSMVKNWRIVRPLGPSLTSRLYSSTNPVQSGSKPLVIISLAYKSGSLPFLSSKLTQKEPLSFSFLNSIGLSIPLGTFSNS